MELEQAKLEELEGGDSRIADEEEFGDGDDLGMEHSRPRAYGSYGESKDESVDDISRSHLNNLNHEGNYLFSLKLLLFLLLLSLLSKISIN